MKVSYVVGFRLRFPHMSSTLYFFPTIWEKWFFKIIIAVGTIARYSFFMSPVIRCEQDMFIMSYGFQ